MANRSTRSWHNFITSFLPISSPSTPPNQLLQVKENLYLFLRALDEAILLVVIVSLIGFWEWRLALIMALAIPITLAMTFGVVYMLGNRSAATGCGNAYYRAGALVDVPVVSGGMEPSVVWQRVFRAGLRCGLTLLWRDWIEHVFGFDLDLHSGLFEWKVAGVVSVGGSYRPAVILDKQPSDEGRLPVALFGKVYCKVDAQYAPIEVGDLLTTSDTVGHAMKACDSVRAFGAVIGKALGSLTDGRGLIPILISLQ
ncbi:MAG: hypothetical protein JWQ49_5852 [Edaphobacter sp.]|nr:hypothetical protein [Edaphobacter sp.]